MKHFSTKAIMLGAAAILGWAGATNGAMAAPDFKDQRINVIIGSSPGGGTDGTTRLVGRYPGKYLPGQPRML